MSAQQEDTYSYKGWLNSDSFLKRALAVVGYSIAGTFVVYAIICIPVFFIAFLLGLFSNM